MTTDPVRVVVVDGTTLANVREATATLRFPPALLSEKGDLMILPHRHGMDGAFAARMRRA